MLTGCSTKPQPDKDEDPVPDTNLDQEPVINNVSFNGMNNDITKLEGSFDNIKSLQEMTNVNYNDSIYTKTSISSKSNFSDMVRLSLENEDEENNVVDYTNRFTYNEELDNLIFESIFQNKEYIKLNIGRNKEGKLYYSYIKTEFTDEPNIKNGLKYYGSIEYLEDSYYNSYETIREECSVESGNNRTYLYCFRINCYEVDLTVEGGMYYNLLDIEGY